MPNKKLRYGAENFEEPGRTTAKRRKAGPADAATRRKKLDEALAQTEKATPPPPSVSRARNKEMLETNSGTVALREKQLKDLGE
jgi:hypothetical protein